MSKTLFTSKRFAPLFWTQFLSAFNDNFLKNSLVFVILFKISTDLAPSLITLSGATFIAPFFFLSAIGGEIADRYNKALIAQNLKLAEIGASLISVIGFIYGSVPILLLALFLFGVISALFGPIKYGILPDHLQQNELPKANAIIEAGTFLAILFGTILAGLIATKIETPVYFVILIISLTVSSWLMSLAIPSTAPGAPNLKINKNIIQSTWHLLKDVSGDQRVWRTCVITSWFWLVGSVVLALLAPLIKNTLGGNETVITVYLAIFAISIAVGSAMAAWLSAGRIILLPVPIAAFLMAIFGFDLSWVLWSLPTIDTSTTLGIREFFAQPGAIRIAIDMAGLAIAGGLYAVPSFAAVQAWADKSKRARVIAAVNILCAAFIALGGIAVAAFQALGVSIAIIILGLSVLNLIASYVILKVMPTSPFRDFVSILFRAFHRLEIEGLENIEKAGKNPILALNHVSLLDGPLALTLTQDEPVFAIDHTIAQKWWVRPFLKLTRAMPLDPTRPMATRQLIKAVNEGNPLVIFPEGRLTVTGSLMKVYDGAGLIADKTNANVVPIRIEGLEKSRFSYLRDDQVSRSFFPKVKVTILEPVKLCVPDELRGRKRRQTAGMHLYQVMSDLVFRTTQTDRTIFEALLASVKENGRHSLAVEDPVTGPLNYGKLLIGARAIGKKLCNYAEFGKTIGVMLPNANGAAVTIMGLLSAGRIPAMINFTSGAKNIRSSCKAAEVETILTSRAFIEKAKLTNLIEELSELKIVYLEDIRETITIKDKLSAMIHSNKPIAKREPEDPAVVLFTSGSEGTPKGVALSHKNILSNAAQASARIDFGRRDKVFNVLPVFHSFGLTVGLVLPLISGVPVFLYPSPLHYRIVPELVYQTNSTILFGTDTFLTGYARTAHAYDLRSLRYILAGAEPVKVTTRHTYMEKFGIRILEGYGVTETAPIISINTPMHNRTGTVGRLMPGMEMRLEEVPGVEEGKRLHVKGPNVMLGYYRAENPGVLERLEDGWHDTGDIVSVDEDGFIKICGRAKRFAKIAGEMVSLAAVEALASELWQGAPSAVTTIPDARKGEKLILVTEAENATRSDFQTFAKEKGAMDLMVPAEVINAKVPLLGSGKIDFNGVKTLVEELRQAPLRLIT